MNQLGFGFGFGLGYGGGGGGHMLMDCLCCLVFSSFHFPSIGCLGFSFTSF